MAMRGQDYIPVRQELVLEEGEVDKLFERLEKIIKAWKERTKPIIITVPEVASASQPGTMYFQMQPGTYEFNFYEGLIRFGTQKTNMRNYLNGKKEEYMRSFRLFSDQDVMIHIDDAPLGTVIGGESISFPDQQFQRLYIDATVVTNIRLWASTSPMVVVSDVVSLPIVSNALYSVTGAAIQTVSLDLGSMGRSNIEVMATATVATPFQLQASLDGVHWFTTQTYAQANSVHDGLGNAFRYVKFSNTAAMGGTLSLLIIGARY